MFNTHQDWNFGTFFFKIQFIFFIKIDLRESMHTHRGKSRHLWNMFINLQHFRNLCKNRVHQNLFKKDSNIFEYGILLYLKQHSGSTNAVSQEHRVAQSINRLPSLRSWSPGPGIEPHIGFPAQWGVCFFLSLCPSTHALSLARSLSQINKKKYFFEKKKRMLTT